MDVVGRAFSQSPSSSSCLLCLSRIRIGIMQLMEDMILFLL